MKIIIYGIGRFAEYVAYMLSNDSDYEICGFCVENSKDYKIKQMNGFPVFDFKDVGNHFPSREFGMFIAVGNNWIRERVFKEAKDIGYTLISYISSKSIIWPDLSFGENVFISEDSGIQPFTKIGNNTIIIGSKIGHHCIVGNNVLMSCSYVGGGAIIEDNVFTGLNSSIKHGLRIRKNCIIGMGSVISKSTDENKVYSPDSLEPKVNLSSLELMKRYL